MEHCLLQCFRIVKLPKAFNVDVQRLVTLIILALLCISMIFFILSYPLPHITRYFVESLNNVVQKGQMDLNIRYWDSDVDQVATRYLGSEFLGRPTAQDVLETFLNGVDKFD